MSGNKSTKTSGRTKKSKVSSKRSQTSKLTTLRAVMVKAWQVSRTYWRTIAMVSLVYGGLFFVFSEASTAVDLSALRTDVEDQLGIESSSVGGQLLTASLLLQSTSTLDQSGAVFMLFVGVFTSLALIWVLRHAWAGKTTTAREAFYGGMYPVVPFILLMLRGLVQLLPLFIGSYLYATAVSRDILINGVELWAAFVLLIALPAVWSGSQLIKTLFAGLVVTIPNMTPSEAYRSASEMLKGRRSYAIRMILGFSLVVGLAVGLLLLVSIATTSLIAVVVSLLVNMLALPVFVIFVYSLYREML